MKTNPTPLLPTSLRIVVTVAACMALVLGTGATLAGPQGGRGGHGPYAHGHAGSGPGPGMMGGLFHQLDLTDEQSEQVRTKIEAHMEGPLGEYTRQQDEIRQELRQLIHDPAADENAIADAARRVSGYCELVALERHRLIVDLFEVLDEQQRQQATELLNELPDRPPNFRQRRRLAPGAE